MTKSRNIADAIGKVRIEDVARAANVSIMSVSRAMRGVEGISQTKREEILNIARKVGYYPNRVAVSLAASSSNLIGVSVPTLFGTVFSEIYDAMRQRFEKNGYATMIDITDYNQAHEEAWVERMISWRPAGLILSGVSHSSKTQEHLSKANIPVLEIWDSTDNPIDLCVGVDHFQAGIDMGKYLAGLGYHTPAYIGIESGKDTPSERRLAGLNLSFKAVNTDFVAVDRTSDNSSFENGFNATLRVLESSSERPDIFCFLNDNMAFGGLMACEKMAVTCPQEIGIVGYNGLNINTVLPQRITTSITPRREMGEKGASVLIAKILGAQTTSLPPLKVEIAPGATTQNQVNFGE